MEVVLISDYNFFLFLLFLLTAFQQQVTLHYNNYPMSAFTASSFIKSTTFNSSNSRKGGTSAWCPAHAYNQWLQIDLGADKTIGGIGTEGYMSQNNKPNYVTKYSVSYSRDGNNWVDYPKVTRPTIFMVDLRCKARYQRGYNAHISGSKLATSTHVLSIHRRYRYSYYTTSIDTNVAIVPIIVASS